MRYHFDLENAYETIRDERGVIARDLTEVVEQVILGVNEMRLSGVLVDTQDWSIVIRDDAGTELTRIQL